VATKKNLTGEEQSLRFVVAGTVEETGTEIFRALAKNLATVMGTAGTWGTEYLPETRQVRSQTNVNALTTCALSKL
jgi:hypothetical protein